MTDDEIIKSLECCTSSGNCDICPQHSTDCVTDLIKLVDDLITCQQEDIENLKIENQSLRAAANSYKLHYNEARAEAVKEFAERLKDYAEECKRNGYDGIGSQDIDDISKEMVGDTE